MDYIIVVFKSRTESVKFNKLLYSNGIYSQLINTPKEANVGCGLSVKVPSGYLYYVQSLINMSALKSFVGIYKIYKNGKKDGIVRI